MPPLRCAAHCMGKAYAYYTTSMCAHRYSVRLACLLMPLYPPPSLSPRTHTHTASCHSRWCELQPSMPARCARHSSFLQLRTACLAPTAAICSHSNPPRLGLLLPSLPSCQRARWCCTRRECQGVRRSGHESADEPAAAALHAILLCDRCAAQACSGPGLMW